MIIIHKKPDVHVTEEEYNRYFQEYQRAFMFYSGVVPSLEEFIRRRKKDKLQDNNKHLCCKD